MNRLEPEVAAYVQSLSGTRRIIHIPDDDDDEGSDTKPDSVQPVWATNPQLRQEYHDELSRWQRERG
jgi:hypothetical protein